jgi:hypothetical protein
MLSTKKLMALFKMKMAIELTSATKGVLLQYFNILIAREKVLKTKQEMRFGRI